MNYFQAFRAFCFTSWVSYLAVACFPTPAFGLFCGDSEPDLGEQCDDGNTTSGDGCSNTCLVEAGAVCTDAVAGVTEVNVVPNGNFELGKQDWTETSSDGSGPVFDPSSSGGNNLRPTRMKAVSGGYGWGDGLAVIAAVFHNPSRSRQEHRRCSSICGKRLVCLKVEAGIL